MKKYCLTQCFKRKMSKRWKGLLEFLVAIGIMLAIIAVITALSAIVGYTLDYFFEIEEKNIVGIGFLTLTLAGLASVTGYHLFGLLKKIWNLYIMLTRVSLIIRWQRKDI